jgi:5-deoxy-glucuronate isomerase
VTIRFELPVLEPAQSVTLTPGASDEGAVVLLRGDVTFNGTPATRSDVFEQRASAAYLPPGASVIVTANVQSELAFATTVDAHLPSGGAPVCVRPSDVVVQQRGQPGWQRAVHDVIDERVPAHTMLVGETFNEPGGWSSFPPHKHDDLEELYYHRFDKPDGFGFQGLYDDSSTEAVLLRHGSVVAIPRGYHPVCAAPGYHLYYLWVLVGRPRRLAMEEDPAHRWLHGA